MNGKLRERKNTIEKTDGKIIPPILPLFSFSQKHENQIYKIVKMVGNIFADFGWLLYFQDFIGYIPIFC